MVRSQRVTTSAILSRKKSNAKHRQTKRNSADKERRNILNNTYDESAHTAIPVWKRYTLTVTEAAEYYHIGEGKLRSIAEEHKSDDFIIFNGNRVLFKRERFEEFLDRVAVI